MIIQRRSFYYIAICCAVLVTMMTAIVLMSWQFDLEPLKSIIPGLPVMTPLTAVLLQLFSFSLIGYISAQLQHEGGWKKHVGLTFAIAGLIISVFTVVQYLFGLPASIEYLLYKDSVLSYGANYPGRPSPHTAITGIVTGVALVFTYPGTQKSALLSSVFGSIILVIPWLALFGYISTSAPLYAMKEDYATGISLLTSVCYILLGLSVMFIHPEKGIVKLIFSDKGIGKLVRILIPGVVLIQVLLSWAMLYYEGKGILAGVTSVAMIGGVSSIIYIIIILWGSTVQYNYERAREMSAIQLKRMVNSLEHSEERFRNLVEYAPYGIIIVNKKGEIQLVNEHAQQLFGYEPDELKGKKIEVLVPDSYKKDHHLHRAKYMQHKQKRQMGSLDGDLKGRRKDGSEFWVDVALASMKSVQEDDTLTIATIRDISERRLVEIERKQYTKELEARNKEMEQFAYITSHDLQEPLRSMAGFVNLLKEEYKGKLDEEADTYIDFISGASTRMSTLIHDLLNYTRIGSKREFAEVDCNKVVEEVKADLTHKINNAKATVNSTDLPVIHGLETEMRILFQNLISNAIKYRKKDVAPTVDIDCEKKDDHWYFTIADNGIGIAEKHAQKIFTIFQRLHLQSEYEGTGIGLAECKKIVELHGGVIGVKGTVGVGSTFYFTIPLKELK